MGRQTRVEWSCDTPSCDTIDQTVEKDAYGGHAPPIGWSLLTLSLSRDECECDCHNYDCDDEDEEEPDHEEEDCPTCPPEGTQGQICICHKCTIRVQLTYYKKEN
jgi:hypothetical protein